MIEHIKIFPNIDELSKAAVDKTIEWAKTLLETQKLVSIALPGGNSPKAYYRMFSREYSQSLPWERIHFFTIDEQISPDSQKGWIYQQAESEFISSLAIPKENLHRAPFNAASPLESALLYEKDINQYLAQSGNTGIDILILGIGADGHVACLYPRQESLNEKEKKVVAIHPPEPDAAQDWVTITYPLFNQAQYALFLVSGKSKSPVLSLIYNYPEEARRSYPCARIAPLRELLWAADQEAFGFDPSSL